MSTNIFQVIQVLDDAISCYDAAVRSLPSQYDAFHSITTATVDLGNVRDKLQTALLGAQKEALEIQTVKPPPEETADFSLRRFVEFYSKSKGVVPRVARLEDFYVMRRRYGHGLEKMSALVSEFSSADDSVMNMSDVSFSAGEDSFIAKAAMVSIQKVRKAEVAVLSYLYATSCVYDYNFVRNSDGTDTGNLGTMLYLFLNNAYKDAIMWASTGKVPDDAARLIKKAGYTYFLGDGVGIMSYLKAPGDPSSYLANDRDAFRRELDALLGKMDDSSARK